jgi:hypothetical protein
MERTRTRTLHEVLISCNQDYKYQHRIKMYRKDWNALKRLLWEDLYLLQLSTGVTSGFTHSQQQFATRFSCSRETIRNYLKEFEKGLGILTIYPSYNADAGIARKYKINFDVLAENPLTLWSKEFIPENEYDATKEALTAYYRAFYETRVTQAFPTSLSRGMEAHDKAQAEKLANTPSFIERLKLNNEASISDNSDELEEEFIPRGTEIIERKSLYDRDVKRIQLFDDDEEVN